MLARAKTLEGRGAYFDLVTFAAAMAKFQPTNTPAISLLYALEAQLARIERDGGVEGRWRRHDAMRRRVEAWKRRDRHRVPAARGDAAVGPSPASRSLMGARQGRGGRVEAAGLDDRGRYGALKDSTIRIGHMATHTVDSLHELLTLIAAIRLDRGDLARRRPADKVAERRASSSSRNPDIEVLAMAGKPKEELDARSRRAPLIVAE